MASDQGALKGDTSRDLTSVDQIPLGNSPDGRSWCALTSDPLPIGSIYEWAVQPDCGAVVLFSGTVRDHAEHRTGVTLIEYEAYESQVVPRLHAIDHEIRERWTTTGRVALLHRIGPLALSESSVVIAVSSPHRAEAFEAARFGIDTLKATVPIWKREHWDGGTDWGLASTEITEIAEITAVERLGADGIETTRSHFADSAKGATE